VDLLVPNELEVVQLSGAPADADAESASLLLHEEWGTELIVTLGERGSAILSSDGWEEIAAPSVRVADTVGAGDVFCGWLGAGVAAGKSLSTAARIANTAAALSVSRPGGALSCPSLDDVEARMGEASGSHRATIG
jgi:ribokinase